MTTVEKTAKKMPLAMRGHIAARNYLVRNGFRIMEDGYSCGQGEVDGQGGRESVPALPIEPNQLGAGRAGKSQIRRKGRSLRACSVRAEAQLRLLAIKGLHPNPTGRSPFPYPAQAPRSEPRSLGNLTSRPVFTHSHNPDSYGL